MNEPAQSKNTVRSHIVFFFALLLALDVAWVERSLLILFYVSALLAVVLLPVVRATSRIRVGRWTPFRGAAAVFILLLAVAGALTAFGFLALPPVIRDLQSLSGELPTRIPPLIARFEQIPFANHLDPGEVISWIQGSLSGAATYLLLSFKAWAGALVQVIAGFVLTLYFILEGDVAYRWFLSFVPHEPRQRLDATLRRAAVRMQKWLIGQLSLMLILGTASTIVFLSLGVRYAYALGIVTGLLNIVPVLGVAVCLTLGMLVAAIDSWGRVLGVAIFFAFYLQIENSWLIPRIMRSRVQLPALAIFIALLLGSAMGGIPGAMVAIPTAVLVSVLLDEYLVQKDEKQTAAAEINERAKTGSVKL
ncbi:MAG: AI-2E family transporter [Terracidiphilus sp.]|jgi:predicted PurR-regulated permease PerM